MLIKRIVWALVAVATGLSAAGAAGGQTVGKTPVEELLGAAAAAVQHQDFKKAEDLLKQVVAADPGNVSAHTLAGIVADQRDDLPAAEKHFAIAACLQPNSPETRNNYGAILLRLNRTNEAAAEFGASLRANPGQPSAQVNLARIYFEKGTPTDLLRARGLFETVLRSAPDLEIARALVAIALGLGEKDRAAQDFQKYFSIAEAAGPTAAARVEFGATLLAGNLNAEAVSELSAALSADPKNVPVLVLLSRAYLAVNDVKNAGKTLEAAVASGVDDARIYAALSNVYQAGGYIENAIPAMRLAVEKDPENEIFRARYGILLVDSKAPAAAIIRLQESAKLFPRSAPILLALGIAQMADGKSVEARSSFERSLANDPKSVPALAYLATISVERADYAKAVEIYRRALAIEEKNAYLHFLIAETLAKIPASDAALIEKHLKRATEIDKTFASGHLALGKLEVRSSRWAPAAVEFELAVKYEPQMAEAYYQLGRALTRLKRVNEANAAFAKHKELTESQSAKKETDRRDYLRRLANVRF